MPRPRLPTAIHEVKVQVTRELFRLADPDAVMERQRRFARQCLDPLVVGQAAVSRGARRTAGQAFRPTGQ